MNDEQSLSGSVGDADAGPTAVVYLVDDHQVELDLMERWCRQAGLQTQTFENPELLLQTLDPESHGCVVADLRMPRISGLELQAEMLRRELVIPVIMVTGHGDAEVCRTAFRQGVFDFIEKGFDSLQFVDAIERAIRQNHRDRFRYQVRRQARELIEQISPRERDVMALLSEGMTLKHIAMELKISVQTASKHRSSIFSKLEIDNEVDLYKMILAAELSPGVFKLPEVVVS